MDWLTWLWIPGATSRKDLAAFSAQLSRFAHALIVRRDTSRSGASHSSCGPGLFRRSAVLVAVWSQRKAPISYAVFCLKKKTDTHWPLRCLIYQIEFRR